MTNIFNIEDNGVAVGQLVENGGFEVAIPAVFNEGVTALRGVSVISSPLEYMFYGWTELALADGITAGTIQMAANGPGAYYRIENGKHVYISLNVSTTPSSTTILTLPSEICPPSKIEFTGYARTSTGSFEYIYNGVITSAGAVSIQGATDYTLKASMNTKIAATDIFIDYWLN